MQQLSLFTLLEAPPTALEAKATPGPFLKWPGGKSGIINQIHKPSGSIKCYVEPFIGGGSVFFHLAHLGMAENYHISDINPDLIMAYGVVQKDVEPLVLTLEQLQTEYIGLDKEDRKTMFYRIRQTFNSKPGPVGVEKVASLIFLNKTCFNGLYRVNKAGEFNVAFGKYDNPTICNAPVLRAAHLALQQATIECSDFALTRSWAKAGTWFYLDPPYVPISATSDFTRYAAQGFSPKDQKRLSDFAQQCGRAGAWVAASNSIAVPAELYPGFNRHSITANRSISRKASTRGKTRELLITNY